MICLKHIDTPVGKMRIGATDEGICLFDFQYRRSIDSIMKRIETLTGDEFSEGEHPYFEKLEAQIREYFNGARKEFDLPLHLAGTPFQKSVWEGLLKIPYGETRSYKQQSIFLGNEKAIRAVAGANGENGIAIIVPCHRVIGEDGSLTGYGGGLQRKKWLLDHERKHSGKTGQAELF
jgi:AraC family transcriptional regulator of adaptative response/methylated-DNA-[protein]-cysteine methyltransferase